MPPVYIIAAGEALPGPAVDNEALARRIGVSAEWIDMFIGTKSRHFAVDLDTGEARYTLTDLCAMAAQGALLRAGVPVEQVDFAILATATPDHLMPATVNLVADRLELNEVPTYQVQSGCAGAIQAIDLARRLLQSGEHRTGLVLAGDTCQKHMALDRDCARLPPAELVNFVLFGDGAGALLMSTEPGGHGIEVKQVLNRLTGLGRAPGQTIQWFGKADERSGARAASEDYEAIRESVPAMSTEIVGELLERTAWQPEDVDYILPPQLSGRMTAAIVSQLGLARAKEISRVTATGNNGNALPLLQIRALADVMGDSERALVVAVESSKWIKSGLVLEKPEPAL